VLVNIKTGEKYIVLTDYNNSAIYAYYADGTNEMITKRGTATKDIIAIGQYVYNTSESDIQVRIIVISDPIGVELVEGLEYILILKNLSSGKNIIGSEAGVYYPVYIPVGTTFTMSTSDGSTLQSAIKLRMYDENKQELSDYWTFRGDTSERTVTQTQALGTAYYMKWDTQPPVPLQVEVGAKTTYEPYFGNIKYLYETSNSILEQSNSILEQLDQISNKVVKKNLIGMDSSLFYPVDIPVGTVLTMSTADGTALGQIALNLEGYNADKNQVDSWNFNPGTSKRTITWTKNDAYYLRWSRTPIKNVQVELGSEATDYQKYIVDVSNESIIDELLRGNSATTDLEVQSTFVSDYTEHDYMSAVSKYNALVLESSGDNEQFLFFTDPHLAVQTGGGEGMLDITYDFINHLNAVYNASPVSFFVDGGDWLGNSDTPGVAANKLTFIDGFMRKKIKDYYPLNGNHDTNYQGKATPESETYTGKISNAILIKLRNVFRYANRMYYHFSGATSSWYCFDTGTENEQIGTYQNAQLSWFATSLLSDSSEHIVIAAHILIYGHSIQEIQPLTDELLKIAEAFNARQTISVDGQSYDYSARTGKVSFCITGHLHDDWNGTVHNIPCIITTNATSRSKLTFDLCLADWESKTLYLQRVGNGSDRTITIL